MNKPSKSKASRTHLESIQRIKLVVAYDGENYSGWQYQTNGISVQQVVEGALKRFYPSFKRLHGSSRTDAGVHALGMVAHFDIPLQESTVPIRRLKLALNRYLPEDVRIVDSHRCSPDFHSRFDALGKQYRYFIWNAPAMNPLMRKQAWHVPGPLDVVSMKTASSLLTGTNDFKSFAGQHAYEVGSTVRTLNTVLVKRSREWITIIMEADGFLYRMCRNLVGTLVQVGQGKMDAGAMRSILDGKHRSLAGMTAPPQGLVLWKVFYPRQGKGREDVK